MDPEPPPDWISTWLTKEFHGLPHLNLSFMPVSDVFDSKNFEYKLSLTILGFLPALLALFTLVPFFAFKLIFPANPTSVDCPCKEGRKELMYVLGALCIILMIIVFVLEIVIHNTARDIAKPPYLYADILMNLQDNAKQYRSDKNVTHLKYALPYIPAALKEPLLWPIRLEIGKFMTDFQRFLASLRLPELPPKELQSPGLTRFYETEHTHFVIMIVFWLIGIVLAIAYPHRYWQIAAAGLAYACIMAGIMLAKCVAVSDICIYPGVFFNFDYLHYDERKNEMNKYAILMCVDMNDVIETERPKTEKLFEFYRNNFFRNWKQLEYEFSKKSKEEQQDKDLRFTVYETIEDKYFKPSLEEKPGWKWLEYEKRIACEDQFGKFKEEMIPLEDLTPLCYLVDYMGAQFFLLIILIFVYITMLLRHATNLRTLAYYRKVWAERQTQSLMLRPPPCDKSICEGSNVCVCNEAKVSKLTKTELAEIEKQGRVAEQLTTQAQSEQEEKDKEFNEALAEHEREVEEEKREKKERADRLRELEAQRSEISVAKTPVDIGPEPGSCALRDTTPPTTRPTHRKPKSRTGRKK